MRWGWLLIAGLVVSATAQSWMDAQPRAPLTVADALYVNSGEALKRASIGFDGLMADVYWIRTLLYFGKKFDEQRRANQYFDVSELKLLEPLLNLTVELDPHLLDAYRLGAVFLPEINAGSAIRFVELGIRNNPGEWRLYQDLGFVHWRQKHYREAADAYARGATLPGAPAWMQTMPPLMLAKGGDRETAREIFRRLYEESDEPFVKQVCEEQLRMLEKQEQKPNPQSAIRNPQS
jgi:tetratricopeptide (TPR) repeat protein